MCPHLNTQTSTKAASASHASEVGSLGGGHEAHNGLAGRHGSGRGRAGFRRFPQAFCAAAAHGAKLRDPRTPNIPIYGGRRAGPEDREGISASSVNRGACLTLSGTAESVLRSHAVGTLIQSSVLRYQAGGQGKVSLDCWSPPGGFVVGSWFFCSLTGEGTFVLDRSFMKVNDMRADDRGTLVVGMTSRSAGGISFDDMTSELHVGRDVSLVPQDRAVGSRGAARRVEWRVLVEQVADGDSCICM